MNNENIQPVQVDTILAQGMILFLASALILLDALVNHLMRYAPPKILWYVTAFALTSIVLGFAWQMSRKTKILDVVVDLCIYDVLIQLFGMLMFFERWNPPAPDPIPYHVAAISIALLRTVALLWPLFIKTPWPVIGIYSWINRRNATETLPIVSRPMMIALIILPMITTVIAYQILCTSFGNEIRLEIHWMIGLILIVLYYRNLNAQARAKEVYAKEQDEFNEIASTHYLYNNDLSDDDRMIMQFVATDPMRGK
jgi:hypothetical protein